MPRSKRGNNTSAAEVEKEEHETNMHGLQASINSKSNIGGTTDSAGVEEKSGDDSNGTGGENTKTGETDETINALTEQSGSSEANTRSLFFSSALTGVPDFISQFIELPILTPRVYDSISLSVKTGNTMYNLRSTDYMMYSGVRFEDSPDKLEDGGPLDSINAAMRWLLYGPPFSAHVMSRPLSSHALPMEEIGAGGGYMDVPKDGVLDKLMSQGPFRRAIARVIGDEFPNGRDWRMDVQVNHLGVFPSNVNAPNPLMGYAQSCLGSRSVTTRPLLEPSRLVVTDSISTRISMEGWEVLQPWITSGLRNDYFQFQLDDTIYSTISRVAGSGAAPVFNPGAKSLRLSTASLLRFRDVYMPGDDPETHATSYIDRTLANSTLLVRQIYNVSTKVGIFERAMSHIDEGMINAMFVSDNINLTAGIKKRYGPIASSLSIEAARAGVRKLVAWTCCGYNVRVRLICDPAYGGLMNVASSMLIGYDYVTGLNYLGVYCEQASLTPRNSYGGPNMLNQLNQYFGYAFVPSLNLMPNVRVPTGGGDDLGFIKQIIGDRKYATTQYWLSHMSHILSTSQFIFPPGPLPVGYLERYMEVVDISLVELISLMAYTAPISELASQRTDQRVIIDALSKYTPLFFESMKSEQECIWNFNTRIMLTVKLIRVLDPTAFTYTLNGAAPRYLSLPGSSARIEKIFTFFMQKYFGDDGHFRAFNTVLSLDGFDKMYLMAYTVSYDHQVHEFFDAIANTRYTTQELLYNQRGAMSVFYAKPPQYRAYDVGVFDALVAGTEGAGNDGKDDIFSTENLANINLRVKPFVRVSSNIYNSDHVDLFVSEPDSVARNIDAVYQAPPRIQMRINNVNHNMQPFFNESTYLRNVDGSLAVRRFMPKAISIKDIDENLHGANDLFVPMTAIGYKPTDVDGVYYDAGKMVLDWDMQLLRRVSSVFDQDAFDVNGSVFLHKLNRGVVPSSNGASFTKFLSYYAWMGDYDRRVARLNSANYEQIDSSTYALGRAYFSGLSSALSRNGIPYLAYYGQLRHGNNNIVCLGGQYNSGFYNNFSVSRAWSHADVEDQLSQVIDRNGYFKADFPFLLATSFTSFMDYEFEVSGDFGVCLDSYQV